MTSRILVFSCTLALVACKSDEKSASDDDTGGTTETAAATAAIEGVWLLRLPYTELDEDDCDITIRHNYLDASTAGESVTETPWTESTTTDYSDALFFVQVEQLGADRAVMLMGGQVLPGEGSGTEWTFTWENRDRVEDSTSHESGYTTAESTTSTSTVTLTLSVTGDTATGSWSAGTSAEQGWSETDEWNEAQVGLLVGSIPSSYYVFGAMTGEPLYNYADTDDCQGAVCELAITQSCSQSASVSMDRTGHDQEDSFDYLEDLAQPFGTGG